MYYNVLQEVKKGDFGVDLSVCNTMYYSFHRKSRLVNLHRKRRLGGVIKLLKGYIWVSPQETEVYFRVCNNNNNNNNVYLIHNVIQRNTTKTKNNKKLQKKLFSNNKYSIIYNCHLIIYNCHLRAISFKLSNNSIKSLSLLRKLNIAYMVYSNSNLLFNLCPVIVESGYCVKYINIVIQRNIICIKIHKQNNFFLIKGAVYKVFEKNTRKVYKERGILKNMIYTVKRGLIE